MADYDRREHHRGDRDDRRDRERRRRSRSRDRRDGSGDRYSRRSRSPYRPRSRSPGYDPDRKRRRPTWFDIPPVAGAPPHPSQLPGAVQVVSDQASKAQGVSGNAFVAAASQQATRHARRVYVGGLPAGTTEESLATFLSNALAAIGGTVAGPGSCVLNVYVNTEKKFAFVELRTVEETSNAIALDGIMLEGLPLRIRRPADYQAAAAAPLGPSAPNPNLNLAAIGLDRRAADAVPSTNSGSAATSAQPVPQGHPDAAHRIFVGGLPYYFTEEQIRELLGSFGPIKSFDLIRDRETQQSKGYGFVVYEDPSVTETACAGLHGMAMGERHLTVRLANEGARLQQQAQGTQDGTVEVLKPPRVVKLTEAVTVEELADDDEYNDILEDMREECGKYGTVVQVHIPRPGPPGAPPVPGVGKVLVEYAQPGGAIAARNALHGKMFGGRVVVASLMTEEDYALARWD